MEAAAPMPVLLHGPTRTTSGFLVVAFLGALSVRRGRAETAMKRWGIPWNPEMDLKKSEILLLKTQRLICAFCSVFSEAGS